MSDYFATLIVEPISPCPSDASSPPDYTAGNYGQQHYDGSYQTEISLNQQTEVVHGWSGYQTIYTPEASPVSDEKPDLSTYTLHEYSEDNQKQNYEERTYEIIADIEKKPNYEQLCSELFNSDNTTEKEYSKTVCKQETYPVPGKVPDFGFDEYKEDQIVTNDYTHQEIPVNQVNSNCSEEILSDYQKVNPRQNEQYSENCYVRGHSTECSNGQGYSYLSNVTNADPNNRQEFQANHRRSDNNLCYVPRTQYLRIPHFQEQSNFDYKPENSAFLQANVKRVRTSYTDGQIKRLEEEFNKDQYTDRQHRILLSMELHLTEKNIKIWYQNRRMKFKKEQAKQSGCVKKSISKRKRKAIGQNRATNTAALEYSTTASTQYSSRNQVVQNMLVASDNQSGYGSYFPPMGHINYYPPRVSSNTFSNIPTQNYVRSNIQDQLKIPSNFGDYTNYVSSPKIFINL